MEKHFNSTIHKLQWSVFIYGPILILVLKVIAVLDVAVRSDVLI